MHGFDDHDPRPLRPADPAAAERASGHDPGGFSPELSGNGRRALRTGVARLDGFVPASPGAQPDPRALLRGRQRPSGSGATNGGVIGTAGQPGGYGGLGFAKPVLPGGYAWWYVDGLSDDGRHGITLIAFIGSVFSPYYAWSGRSDPLDHCSLNVALYGRRGHRWAMTERGRGAIARGAASFRIGPSRLAWNGNALSVFIDEITTPLRLRIKGHVRLYPAALMDNTLTLDKAGRHRWRPAAPCARIEVELERPSLRWSGSGYLDINDGDEPLEDGFSHWNWARADLDGGRRAAMLYDVIDRQGGHRGIALHTDRQGRLIETEPPAAIRLPRTIWQMPRMTRADRTGGAKVVSTLEDTPFYARSLLSAHLFGEDTRAMHESLSLDRFATRWVKALLPYRMPRRAG